MRGGWGGGGRGGEEAGNRRRVDSFMGGFSSGILVVLFLWLKVRCFKYKDRGLRFNPPRCQSAGDEIVSMSG